jgi:hypothetical protein
MTTIRFQEVTLRGVWRWQDAEGKWHQQTKKFFQTLNPFNKTADGTVKTREQIMQELRAERQAWYDKCSRRVDG